MGRYRSLAVRYLLLNPSVLTVDPYQVYANANLAPVISLFARHPVILSSITFPIRGGAKDNIYYRLVG